jgi:methionine-rich copper-binding protein CopC
LHTILAVTGMQHVTARRPVDGAVLAAPPRALTLTFSSPLGEPGGFTVRSPAGQATYRARLDPGNAGG